MQQKKRLSSVCKFDVRIIGKTLKYNLISQNIDLKEIDKYLFNEENKKSERVNMNDLQEVLKKDPFRVSNELELIQLSRYLVEDNNTQDYIDYKPETTQSIHVVRSIFKSLVEQYKLFIDDEKELSDIITKNVSTQGLKTTVQDQLTKTRGHKKGGRDPLSPKTSQVEMEEVFEVLELHHIFKQREADFFFYQLFLTTKDINEYDLTVFFQKFHKDDVVEE